MGTNYYYNPKVCKECGHIDEGIHIGKSSAGWCFALHVAPEGGWDTKDIPIANLEDWKKLFYSDDAKIEDEYGDLITPDEMMSVITKRSWDSKEEHKLSYLVLNEAEVGPNGLLRMMEGERCVGHGDGTWDLVIGEFS